MLKISSFSLTRNQSIAVLLIVLLSVVAYLFDELIADTLVYNRTLIEKGELWRIFTGHFLHTNGYHLLLNVSAMLLLLALHGKFYHTKSYTLIFLTCAFFTSLGLYLFSPNIDQYVGLSGILHGVFVFGAIMDIKHKDKTGYLLFIGVWLKIIHEQTVGASAEVAKLIGANVAIDAHLWGAVGGLFFSLLYLKFSSAKV